MKNKIGTMILAAAAVAAIGVFAKNDGECGIVHMNGRKGDVLAAVKRDFADPPREYGVNCWWWWLNGNTDKAAISRELAAMKEKKFQGAMIFDAGGHNQRGNDDIPAGPLFGSDEWCDLFAYALDEAEKFGIEISEDDANRFVTVGDVVEYLESL